MVVLEEMSSSEESAWSVLVSVSLRSFFSLVLLSADSVDFGSRILVVS